MAVESKIDSKTRSLAAELFGAKNKTLLAPHWQSARSAIEISFTITNRTTQAVVLVTGKVVGSAGISEVNLE